MDEGLHEVTQALKVALAYDGEYGKIIRLEELCLRGNRLTAKSLLSLGEIIARASSDLRDIDLSENLISISTKEDKDAWEYFLISFSKCNVLRKIDFSRNELNSKAFEIFSRVYLQEEPLDIEASDGFNNESTRTVRTQSQSNLHGFLVTKGLRSVPYIAFCDTSMNDVCALHLSYVLASHHLPTRLLSLVPPAKAGPSAQKIDAYNMRSKCQGIIYLPNDRLTAAGTKVLEFSELARANLIEDGSYNDTMAEAETIPKVDSTPRRASETPSNIHPSTSGHRRRTASMGVAELDTYRYGSTDLDRARSRIQGDTLRDVGPSSNDLWRASLKFLSLARILLVQGVSNSAVSQQSALEAEIRQLPSRHGHLIRATTNKSSGMIPLAPKNPNQALNVKLPSRSKESFLPPQLQMTSVVSPSLRNARIISSLRDPNQSYRGPYIGQLHQAQWARIIALAADAVGIVGQTQQKAILAQAIDMGSLGKEREHLGKSGSAQIWKALEGMGCLAYEMR